MEGLRQNGHISDKIYGHYCFLWLWGTPRCDSRHRKFYNRFGAKRYCRRIDRIKALIEKIRLLRVGVNPENVPFAIGSLNR